MRSPERRASERGSALLIVLVFAAMIAIMLYRELPVATFEAQRQKEELLMDRGNEYKRAIQLYVRKVQSFPPSLEALENTNRMRFLRGRYVDPFTGKADWRILHAGPGGIILDSKIKQTSSPLNAASGGSGGSTLGAPSSVTNPFANSFDGSNATGARNGGGPNFPQRPPAMAAGEGGGSAPGAANDPMAAMMQNGGQPLDPQALAAAAQNQGLDPSQMSPTVPYPGYPAPPDPSTGMGGASNSGSFPMAGGAGRYRGNPAGNSYPPGQFPGMAPPVADGTNPMAGQLGNQNPIPVPGPMGGFGTTTPPAQQTTAFPASSGMGTMGSNMGGGIAGVASNAPGKTIKVLNDQKDRSLWEFVYDMKKEQMANAPGGGTGLQNGSNNGSSTSTGGFGSSSSSTGFGSTNSPSSFGGNNPAGTSGQSTTFQTPQPQSQP